MNIPWELDFYNSGTFILTKIKKFSCQPYFIADNSERNVKLAKSDFSMARTY